jgi:type VI secretion system secreted protein VgrG
MQERRTIRYELHVGALVLVADRVIGVEELGRPFRFEVRARVERALGLSAVDLVRTGAAVVLVDSSGPLRRVDGVITDLRIGATRAGTAPLQATIEPRWALSRHSTDMRVFRELDTVEIVRTLLEPHGVELDVRLAGRYDKRPQCLQLRESALDFTLRLLEEEGIVAFDAPSDELVLVDGKSGYVPWEGPPLPFRATAELELEGEAVLRIAERADLGPELVAVRDFRRASPRRPISASAMVAAGRGRGVHDVWLRGGSARRDPDRHARIAAEARRAELEALELDVRSVRLFPGMLLHVGDLPDPSLPAEVLVVRVEHAHGDGARERPGALRVHAVASDRSYRVPQRTTRPAQAGPLTAFVMGPLLAGNEPGSDVHTDALGRVKVRYPWDRTQPFTEQASDWVPVMQDQTGGSCAIPRVGSEVLVHFFEGDPDRPVVLGRLYNGADPFPEPLPANKTVSAMRSPSSPDRGGGNMIRIDDAAGAERIDVQAERDQRVAIEQDERRDVGAARAREVLGSERISVGKDATTMVGGSAGLTVEGDAHEIVGAKRRVHVGKDDALVVGKDHTLRVASSHLRRIGGADKVAATEIDERTGGAHCELALRGISLSARRSVTTVTGGATVAVAHKGHKSSTRLLRAEAVGGLAISKSLADTVIEARKHELRVGGMLRVDADSAVIQATTLEMDALQSFELAGKESIVLRVGDNELKIVPGAILVTAKKVLVDGKAALHWTEADITG